MIALRRVESEADADVFLALRRAIDPEHMPARTAYLEHIKAPGRVDLLAELDGEPVGAAFVERHGDDLAGPEGWISVRVLREYRRRGVGTALFRAVSRARAGRRPDGARRCRLRTTTQTRGATSASAASSRRAACSESTLDLADCRRPRSRRPTGVELVRSQPGARRTPSTKWRSRSRATSRLPDEVRIGTIDEWRAARAPPEVALRECCFVALAGGEVSATRRSTRVTTGEGLHAMTGVRRAWRRRGIALALKQAQIDAARAARAARAADGERGAEPDAARQRAARLPQRRRLAASARAAARRRRGLIALRVAESDARPRGLHRRLERDHAGRAGLAEQQRERRERDPRRLYLLAESAGEAVGCGFAGPSDSPGRGFLSPRVLPHARRRGVGSALLGRLAAHLSGLGFGIASAHVDGTDAGSLAFAAHHEFDEVHRQVEQVKTLGDEPPPQPPGRHSLRHRCRAPRTAASRV